MSGSKHLLEMVKGSSWVFIGIMFGYVLEFVNKIAIARFLGRANYGVITLSMSIAMILVSVATFGFNSAAPRYIAIHSSSEEKRWIKDIVTTGLKVIIPLGLGICIICFFFRDFVIEIFFEGKDVDKTIIPFMLIIPIAAVGEYFYSCLRGMKLAREATLSKQVLRRLTVLFFVLFAFLTGQKNTELISVGYLVGFILYMALSGICVFRNIPVSSDDDMVGFNRKEYILFSLPLLFSFILARFGMQIGVVFLGYFKSTEDVGLYSAALPFCRFISLPLTVVLFMFLPVMSSCWASNQYQFLNKIFNTVCNWLLIVSGIVTMLFFLYSEEIIVASFGTEFRETHRAFMIVTVGYFFSSITGPVGSLLIVTGRTKEYFIGDLICVLSGAIGYFLVIPIYGFIGCAYVFAGQMILRNFIRVVSIYFRLKLTPFSRRRSLAILLIVMLTTFFKIYSFHFNIYLQLLVLITAYISIIVSCGIVDKDTLTSLLEFKREKP